MATTNDELKKLLISTVDKLADMHLFLINNNKIMKGEIITINERITSINEELQPLSMAFGEVLKKWSNKGPEPVSIKEAPKPIKKTDAPKLPAEGLGKIPEGYKISPTACTRCLHTVAWAPYKKDVNGIKQKQDPPIHCDNEGNIIGDGGHW